MIAHISMVPEPWGESYHQGIPEHIEWTCPGCERGLSSPDEVVTNPRGWYNYVRGFSRDIPGGSVRSDAYRGMRTVVGCFIVECPHCFMKYFMHVTLEEIEMAKSKCPLWPK